MWNLIDHAFIKNTLMADFFINANVENISFPNHDAARIATEQNDVDFHTVSINLIWSYNNKECDIFLLSR